MYIKPIPQYLPRNGAEGRETLLGCLGCPPVDQCIVGQRQAVAPYLGL